MVMKQLQNIKMPNKNRLAEVTKNEKDFKSQ